MTLIKAEQWPNESAQDPPLALDSDFAQSDTAWAKAMERLKSILTFYRSGKEQNRHRCRWPGGVRIVDVLTGNCNMQHRLTNLTIWSQLLVFFVKTFLLSGASIWKTIKLTGTGGGTNKRKTEVKIRRMIYHAALPWWSWSLIMIWYLREWVSRWHAW